MKNDDPMRWMYPGAERERLASLVGWDRLREQVRACRDSEAGHDLDTEETDDQLVGRLVERAADRLPGIPVAAYLDLVALGQTWAWDGDNDCGVTDPFACLVGRVELEGGKEVELVLEWGGTCFVQSCRDARPDPGPGDQLRVE